MYDIFALLILVVAALSVYNIRRRKRGSLPYPPTPPSDFLLGNLRDIQHKTLRYRYDELAKTYGEIFHLSALGQHIVVLNTEEAAYELFTRRSAIYSDRPQLAMVDLMGWDISVAFMKYGERWRSHRRLFQQVLNPRVVANFEAIQTDNINKYLGRLLNDPDHFSEQIEILLGSIIMKIVYGYDIAEDGKDETFTATLKAVQNLANATLPGSWLVNSFPVLRFLPEWFPGCGFRTFAKETREVVDMIVDGPYERAKSRASSDTPCLVTLLEDSIAAGGHRNITESYAKEVCAVAYGSTSETTTAVIDIFYFAMRQNPEIQDKAYREIMAVVGSERLPCLSDRAALPYVEALYREVTRWMPPVPFSLPHGSIEDDVYKGYFIPKGSIVFGNLWTMLNNEEKYPSPRSFMPERFLTDEGKFNGGDIDSVLSFGFGRRICVGRHLADTTVWLLFACILAAFRIEKPRDGISDDIDKLEDIDDAFLHTLVAHSVPFRCSLRARSVEAAEMIRHLNE